MKFSAPPTSTIIMLRDFWHVPFPGDVRSVAVFRLITFTPQSRLRAETNPTRSNFHFNPEQKLTAVFLFVCFFVVVPPEYLNV